MNDRSYLVALSNLRYDEGGIWEYPGDDPSLVRMWMPPIQTDNIGKAEFGAPLISNKGPVLIPQGVQVYAILRTSNPLLPKAQQMKYVREAHQAGVLLKYDPYRAYSGSDARRDEPGALYGALPYDQRSQRRLAILERNLCIEGSFKTLVSLLPPHANWRAGTWKQIVDDARARLTIAKTDRMNYDVWDGTTRTWKGAIVGSTVTAYLGSGLIPPAMWAWTYALPSHGLSVVKGGSLLLQIKLNPAITMVTARATFHIARSLERLKYSQYLWSLAQWAELDVLIVARMIQIINEAPPWYQYLRHEIVGPHDVISRWLPFVDAGRIYWVGREDLLPYRARPLAPRNIVDHDLLIHPWPYFINLEPWAFVKQDPILASTVTLHGPAAVSQPIESIFATLSSTLWVPSARWRLLQGLKGAYTLDDIDRDIVGAYLAWSAILNWAAVPSAKSQGLPVGDRPRITWLKRLSRHIPWSLNTDLLPFLSKLQPPLKNMN